MTEADTVKILITLHSKFHFVIIKCRSTFKGDFFSQTRFFSHHYAQCGPLLIEMSHSRSNCAGVFPPLSFCALLAGYFWHTWAPCSCEFHFRQSLRLPSSLCMFIVSSYPAFCILDFPEPP